MLVSVEDYASLYPHGGTLGASAICNRGTFEASAASSSAPGDSRPLDPQPRWGMGGKPNNSREAGICRQVSSWVKENEKMGDGESSLSPRPIFRSPRCAMRTAGQRVTLAAQERLSAIKPLVEICSIYGDNAASFGSFLGYRKERSRSVFFYHLHHSRR